MDKSLSELKADLKAELRELRGKYNMVEKYQFYGLVEGIDEPDETQKKLLENWKVEKAAIEKRYVILAGLG